MPRPTNLSAMSIDALVKLREDINKILDRELIAKPTFDAGWWRSPLSEESFAERQEGPAEISQPFG